MKRKKAREREELKGARMMKREREKDGETDKERRTKANKTKIKLIGERKQERCMSFEKKKECKRYIRGISKEKEGKENGTCT